MDLPSGTAPLEIQLFGTMAVRIDGAEMPPLRSKRGRWLLALLALRHDRSTEREWLGGTLWPDSTEEQAMGNLRRTLTDLRDALGTAASCLYAPTSQTLRLNLESASVDVLAFDRAVRSQEIAPLEEAVRLYRGPLLEGWTEDWALEARLVRAENYRNALETLAVHAMQAANPAGAIAYLKRAIAADPLRETACRALMQAHLQAGNYAAATATYRELRLLLRRELNAEPDPETTALYRQQRAEIRRRAASVVPAAPVAPRPVAPEPQRGYLPRPLTSFLGREQDLNALIAAVQEERLVTLTGIGGIGKTRLAIRTGAEVAEDFAGGVWFADLSPLTPETSLLQPIADLLGIREQGGRGLETLLGEALGARPLLLILDNCEHLLEACAHFSERMLQRAPTLHILATSRQPLGIDGESVRRVASLSVPEEPIEAQGTFPEALGQYDAPRLFLERSASKGGAGLLTPVQAKAVLQICRRLDGLPLALELAAARTTMLSIEEIAQRLDDRFRLLTGGSRTSLPRHKTLRALFDWSYDLLDDSERCLLRRLAAFQGGWTLEAAEAVCAGKPTSSDATLLREGSLSEEEIFDLLASLVDKSLVLAEAQESPMRFRMLESVREYMQEKLAESGEAGWLGANHAHYYLQQALQQSEALGGPHAATVLKAVVADLENLRKGMDRMVADGAHQAIVAYGKALFGFLRIRGLYHECETRLCLAVEAALKIGDEASRARLQNQRGLVAWERFDLEKARALFTESYRLSQALEDRPRMLSALVNLGNIAWGHSDFGAARSLYEEALQLAIVTEQRRHEATLRLNLGTLAIERGDYDDARALLQASLAIHQQLQSDEYCAHTYYNLAELYRRQRQYATALDYTRRSLDLYTAQGNRRGIALAEVRLGINRLESGDRAGAEPSVRQGLRIAEEIGDQASRMYALEVLARLKAAEGIRTEAEALLRESLQIARQVGDRKHIAQALAHYGAIQLKAGRGEEAYRLLCAAHELGSLLQLKDETLEQKLEEARHLVAPEEMLSAKSPDIEAIFALLGLPAS